MEVPLDAISPSPSVLAHVTQNQTDKLPINTVNVFPPWRASPALGGSFYSLSFRPSVHTVDESVSFTERSLNASHVETYGEQKTLPSAKSLHVSPNLKLKSLLLKQRVLVPH